MNAERQSEITNRATRIRVLSRSSITVFATRPIRNHCMRCLVPAICVLTTNTLVVPADDVAPLIPGPPRVVTSPAVPPGSESSGCGESVCRPSAVLPCRLSDLFGEDCWVQIGGSYRIRFHDENNMRRAGLTGQDDRFTLHQTRVWFDAELGKDVRLHAGFIDAASFGETFRPRAGEVNRSDLYQLYADAVLSDSGGTLTARLGRQEMRYGSARLIMAPVWANRRRTHDGVRMMWRDFDWDVDAFWVHPVFRDVDHFTAFDSSNRNQQLYGFFSTYKKLKDAKLDLYWLAFDIDRAAGTGSAGARYDTLGSRWYGGTDARLFEIEAGYQFGRNPDDSAHSAGFFTGGVGRRFKDVCWSPEVWLFYDWASGSGTTGNGFHTYVQRAHYYLGNMDLFGRRNLQDVNVRLTTRPSEKLTCVVWYHYFMLATQRDVPYNLNMQPFAGLAAGSAGSKDLGHELDLTLTWQMNDQTQLRLGYSHFWAGRFYDTTPGVPTATNADFLYGHFQYKF